MGPRHVNRSRILSRAEKGIVKRRQYNCVLRHLNYVETTLERLNLSILPRPPCVASVFKLPFVQDVLLYLMRVSVQNLLNQ
jgi:hypothetical protein